MKHLEMNLKLGLGVLAALLLLTLQGCGSDSTITESGTSGSEESPFFLVAGYSNTRGVADAVNRLEEPDWFPPADVARDGFKLMVEEPQGGSMTAYVDGALGAQRQYGERLNKRIDAIWWQVGIRGQEAFTPSDRQRELAHDILAELQRQWPGKTIYLSPMTPYVDHVCDISGPGGPATSAILVSELTADFDNVIALPAFTPLRRDQTVDGCHETNTYYLVHAQEFIEMINDLRSQ